MIHLVLVNKKNQYRYNTDSIRMSDSSVKVCLLFASQQKFTPNCYWTDSFTTEGFLKAISVPERHRSVVEQESVNSYLCEQCEGNTVSSFLCEGFILLFSSLSSPVFICLHMGVSPIRCTYSGIPAALVLLIWRICRKAPLVNSA